MVFVKAAFLGFFVTLSVVTLFTFWVKNEGFNLSPINLRKCPIFLILHKNNPFETFFNRGIDLKRHRWPKIEIQLDYIEGGKLARNSNCNKQDGGRVSKSTKK